MPYSDSDLKELRQQFADDTAEWEDIRAEGAIDMRHAAGDPWDPEDRRKREAAGRPCLALDELSQYTNQVVNEVRSNKRAVKFAPVGNGANDKTAEFYADKMREIEYRSRAQIGYTTAFENAVQRSYGFVRVNSRYAHARAIAQDLWIDPVHNPDLITPDPYALMPDLSDMKHCWVREPWTRDEFNKKWPKYAIEEGKSLNELTREVGAWVTDRQVWVSEYWKIKTKTRKLLIFQPDPTMPPPGSMLGLQEPQQPEAVGIFEDDIDPARGLPPGKVIRSRSVEDPTVSQCITNGVEILEENPWPGIYIPIVGCLGKVIYTETSAGAGSTRQILSMIRLARDPYMLYCYYRTCEAELVGMTPKFPYFVRRGSLKQDALLDLQKSLHEPVAVVEVENNIEGRMSQEPPEFPMRQPYEPPIQALEIGAESARRAIQSAIGQSPLPTSAQRRNEKSGVALKHIEETGQRGSFHFTDHYLDMIQHVGVICEDLMDKIYDTARDVGIRKPNDNAETIRINGGGKDSVSTKGDHLVTVSTGPSFDSEREAASDFADLLVTTPAAPAIMDLAVKLKNLGPLGDEMAERLTPPEYRKPKDGEEPTPQMLKQQLAEMGGKLKQVGDAAQQMQKDLETDALKQKATIQKAHIDGATQIELQHIRNAAAIRIAEINAAAKGYAVEDAHMLEHESLALGHAHESHENQLDREHAQVVAEQAHQQALAEGQQDQDHALEQGEQGHQQALEQGDQAVAGQMATQQQAADLAPEPEAGA
jgi:hypothetical protein